MSTKKYTIQVRQYHADGTHTVTDTISRKPWLEAIGNFNPMFCRYKGKRCLMRNIGLWRNPEYDKSMAASREKINASLITLDKQKQMSTNTISKTLRARKPRYENWTRIAWDGNPDLNLECWRKSFGRGHVSIGIGQFNSIVYSHGANSDESMTGARGPLTETQAMALVDACGGYHDHNSYVRWSLLA